MKVCLLMSNKLMVLLLKKEFYAFHLLPDPYRLIWWILIKMVFLIYCTPVATMPTTQKYLNHTMAFIFTSMTVNGISNKNISFRSMDASKRLPGILISMAILISLPFPTSLTSGGDPKRVSFTYKTRAIINSTHLRFRNIRWADG